ncbi:hypothetical protein [Foetidibacter luteolus]|uniref:hypothetical protein n=1 Tax=Foetidibacter luteolus TaxID=2608880 RepID=UPI00129A3CF4|nr:hypothetical protein [Foetidibacter luteolus]
MKKKEYLLIASFCLLLITAAFKVKDAGDAAEQKAITKLIEAETTAYYRQDFETWKDCFVNENYFRQYGFWEGYPEKVKYFNGFDSLKNFKQKQFAENRTIWKDSYEKRHNENFRIYDKVAWYTFEQDSFDGTTHQLLGQSIETRILEKHGGKWKIAYLGFHYLPSKK